MGVERDRLQTSLGRLYALNTLGAVVGAALAGFFLIERVGTRPSLYATAALNLTLGAAALALARPLDPSPAAPAPTARPSDRTQRVALALLAVTAFASLLDEIAWTRVLVMVVGGSTYAFTLVLLAFLLGIGLGSAIVARRSPARPPRSPHSAASWVPCSPVSCSSSLSAPRPPCGSVSSSTAWPPWCSRRSRLAGWQRARRSTAPCGCACSWRVGSGALRWAPPSAPRAGALA